MALFKGDCFSTTGFSIDERAQLTALIEAQGGTVKGELDLNCTYLICARASGKKYEFAIDQVIATVSSEWISRSVAAKAKLPIEDFPIGAETASEEPDQRPAAGRQESNSAGNGSTGLLLQDQVAVIAGYTEFASILQQDLTEMGAEVLSGDSFDADRVTLFVCESKDLDEYRMVADAASRSGRDVSFVSYYWVQNVIQTQMMIDPTTDMLFQPSPTAFIPGMKNLIIAVTGFQGDSRAMMIEYISKSGANYTGPMTVENSHLIFATPSGSKYSMAGDWRLTRVNEQWIVDCVEQWKYLPEEEYMCSMEEMATVRAEAEASAAADKAAEAQTPQGNSLSEKERTPSTIQPSKSPEKTPGKTPGETSAKTPGETSAKGTSASKQAAAAPAAAELEDAESDDDAEELQPRAIEFDDSDVSAEVQSQRTQTPGGPSGQESPPRRATPPVKSKGKKAAKKSRKAEAPVRAEATATTPAKTPPAEPKRLFLFTDSSHSQRENARKIRPLGGKVCKDATHSFDAKATHIVTDQLRRTEKFLCACAAGLWVLHASYVTSSVARRHFVLEDDHEWKADRVIKTALGDELWLGAPHKWRLAAAASGTGNLAHMRVMIYGETTPPADSLRRIIHAGGGKVEAVRPPYEFLNDITHAIIGEPYASAGDDAAENKHIGKFLHNKIPCIKSAYVLDYLSHKTEPSLESYYVCEPLKRPLGAKAGKSEKGTKKKRSSR